MILLRRWLSLSVAELARALHVQRPAIYDWQSGTVPRPENQARFQELYRVGEMWRAMTARPLGTLRKAIPEGSDESFVDVICHDRLDMEQLAERLASLGAQMAPRRKPALRSASRDEDFDAQVDWETATRRGE